jgi:hypothetical protein
MVESPPGSRPIVPSRLRSPVGGDQVIQAAEAGPGRHREGGPGPALLDQGPVDVTHPGCEKRPGSPAPLPACGGWPIEALGRTPARPARPAGRLRSRCRGGGSGGTVGVQRGASAPSMWALEARERPRRTRQRRRARARRALAAAGRACSVPGAPGGASFAIARAIQVVRTRYRFGNAQHLGGHSCRSCETVR